MSRLIAVCGKGGVGKTSVSALIVSRLLARRAVPVLCVDADPNTCLDAALGVRAEHTVGAVREDARQIAGKGVAAGIPQHELLEVKIAECLVESQGFDLIAMGRSEGPGCYCFANNVLKQTIGRLAQSYPFVVLDNEAGLENLSRRIVQKVDVLLMVADPSRRGLDTVLRLHELACQMQVEYGRLVVVVNRVRGGGPPPYAEDVMAATGADDLLTLPEDSTLAELSEQGASLLDVAANNAVAERLDALVAEVAGGVGHEKG